MPIYEYACDSCGHRFERLVRIGAEPPPCPECSSSVRKLVSQSGFILRGGGWYKDHYGLKKSESPGEGGSKKGEGTSGESKGGESPKTTESAPAPAPAPAESKPKTKAATSAAAAK
jgi:putative FmdB family regulatory protein